MAVFIWAVVGACMVGLNSDAAWRFTAALLPMFRLPCQYPFRQPDNFWCDWMRPRIAEAKFGSGFFSGDFRRGFNGGAERVAHHPGKFPVSVIDAP